MDDPETKPEKNVSFEEPEKSDKSVSFVMDEDDDDEEEEEEVVKDDDDEEEEEEIEVKNGDDEEEEKPKEEGVGVPTRRKPGFAGPLYALRKQPVKRKSTKRPKKVVVKDDPFWDCPECTYKNNSEDFKCEMCFASKGTSKGRKAKRNPTLVQDRVAQAMMDHDDKPIATKSMPGGGTTGSTAVTSWRPHFMSDEDDDKSSSGGKSPVTHQKYARDQAASAKWLKYDKLYDCDVCDYQATQQSSLKRHKLAKHEGVRYNCNLCQYTASQMSILKQHKMTEHEGVRYVCDQCDYQATQTSSLKRHKLTQHEGMKQPNLSKLYGISYDCEHCDYRATQLSSLKRHKMAKHEGSRIDCDQCDYHTTTPGNLKLHKKSKHDGIRYPCEICDYEATQPGALNRHKANKHSQYQ